MEALKAVLARISVHTGGEGSTCTHTHMQENSISANYRCCVFMLNTTEKPGQDRQTINKLTVDRDGEREFGRVSAKTSVLLDRRPDYDRFKVKERVHDDSH